MSASELTAMVMATIAIGTVIVQATNSWRSNRKDHGAQNLASWEGLNNALDRQVDKLSKEVDALRGEAEDRRKEIGQLRRKVQECEDKHHDAESRADEFAEQLHLAREHITQLQGGTPLKDLPS